ncbi:MAG: hypothetical protein N2Z74_07200 [Syntrophales bacterium]|nr:hypothetical protein [Syntrophales bacterium]
MQEKIDREALVREFQTQLERKLRENEIAVIQYWQANLAKLLSLKPEGVAALQVRIKKIHDMMGNRIQMLKRG